MEGASAMQRRVPVLSVWPLSPSHLISKIGGADTAAQRTSVRFQYVWAALALLSNLLMLQMVAGFSELPPGPFGEFEPERCGLPVHTIDGNVSRRSTHQNLCPQATHGAGWWKQPAVGCQIVPQPR
jgi:hypothetical protein